MSWVLKGNGGINSTLEDMYKWYVALKRNKVLSQSLTDELTSPYILAKDGGPSYYAYGWAIDNSDRNTKIVSHKGGNRVFFHDFIWVQEEDALILFRLMPSTIELKTSPGVLKKCCLMKVT